MPPSLNHYDREANRRWNQKWLESELARLTTGNRQPNTQPERRQVPEYSTPNLNAKPAPPIVFPFGQPKKSECDDACAITSDSSEDELDVDLEEEKGPWRDGGRRRESPEDEKQEEDKQQQEERQQQEDKQQQERRGLPEPEPMPRVRRAVQRKSAAAGDPGPEPYYWPQPPLPGLVFWPKPHPFYEPGYLKRRDAKESLKKSQETRSQLNIQRQAVALGPCSKDEDWAEAEAEDDEPSLPWEIHPLNAVTLRDYIRRSCQLDGLREQEIQRRLKKKPEVDVGEQRFLLNNVINTLEKARGWRAPYRMRMRLEGDHDPDEEVGEPRFGSDGRLLPPRKRAEGRKDSMGASSKRSFWMNMSVLAGWIHLIK